jgi:hypothetical protein
MDLDVPIAPDLVVATSLLPAEVKALERAPLRTLLEVPGDSLFEYPCPSADHRPSRRARV